MNPLKCAFGVSSGKLLGFQLVASFTSLLKKGTSFVWTTLHQEAFQKIQRILSSPAVMKSHVQGRPLCLYTAFSDTAVGALLAQEDDEGVEHPIYYFSQILRDAELRLVKWLLQMSELDITRTSPRAIKGQSVTDLLATFLGKGTTALHEDLPGEFPKISVVEGEAWMLYFDGSATPSNNTRRAGVVLVSPTGEVFSHFFKLDFQCTNNSAEYEAFLIGLSIAKQAGATRLEIRGDSKLLVNQMNRMYALKEVRELLEEYGIKKVFSTIYYPQGNGQAESTNKTLIRILSRIVHDNPREWNEQLPTALWAYRTAPRSSIGVSPYSLVYGADAILPAEIKVPPARIAATSGVQWNEAKASNSRIAELDTLDSRRSKA
ncbi:uncharacterized protein LOC113350683 [Papaver somniferum]|uniref:uncharacterized protein LOC113350683 n=1 Tax=Papaver somniferum TaxID=3469 RepID=UPI000E6F6191|nr:uncharacterized protein LOC113350683 [Papaver somniferum]